MLSLAAEERGDGVKEERATELLRSGVAFADLATRAALRRSSAARRSSRLMVLRLLELPSGRSFVADDCNAELSRCSLPGGVGRAGGMEGVGRFVGNSGPLVVGLLRLSAGRSLLAAVRSARSSARSPSTAALVALSTAEIRAAPVTDLAERAACFSAN